MSSSKSTLSDITPFGLCCMLFLLHLLSFMCAMVGYTSLSALIYLLVAWEYLGLLSYVLIQH